MTFFERLKLMFRPPRMDDPDFGSLCFMYVSNAPQNSYWEAEWRFPPVGYPISISLPGDPTGPTAEGRAFYLSRVAEFERILELVRPALDAVLRDWLGRPLADDAWSDLKLAGFDVEDPNASPLEWSVSFETTGEKWLGITIPLRGDELQEPTVDT